MTAERFAFTLLFVASLLFTVVGIPCMVYVSATAVLATPVEVVFVAVSTVAASALMVAMTALVYVTLTDWRMS